jgi:hypothetical protein
MKKTFLFLATMLTVGLVFGQDFATDMKNAKTAYTSNNLGDAHFALMQAMQEVDIIIGQEVLKLLPPKIDTASVVTKSDKVIANTGGYVGTTISRIYGTTNTATVTINSNSPMVATLNTILNSPLLGGMMSDGTSKIVKVQGYKGRLQKDGETGYTVEIPMNNSLLTFKTNNYTDAKTLELANTLPVPAIAKLIQ